METNTLSRRSLLKSLTTASILATVPTLAVGLLKEPGFPSLEEVLDGWRIIEGPWDALVASMRIHPADEEALLQTIGTDGFDWDYGVSPSPDPARQKVLGFWCGSVVITDVSIPRGHISLESENYEPTATFRGQAAVTVVIASGSTTIQYGDGTLDSLTDAAAKREWWNARSILTNRMRVLIRSNYV